MSAPISHPLIPDYVHKSSRGKAVALTAIGTVLGEILAICFFKGNVFLGMSFYDSFTASAIFIGLFSFYTLASVKDPDLKKLHKTLNEEKIDFEHQSLP